MTELYFFPHPDDLRAQMDALNRARLQTVAALNQATPAVIAATKEYLAYNPVAQPGIATAAGKYMATTGATLEDPAIQALTSAAVEEEIEQRNWLDGLSTGFKALVRGATTTFDGLYQELVARPLQTQMGVADKAGLHPLLGLTGLGQGLALSRGVTLQDIQETHAQTGRSELNLTLRDLAAGRDVDLGSGYLPGGTVRARSLVEREGATPQTQAAIEQSGATPQVQQQLLQQAQTAPILTYQGKPLTLGRAAAGTILQPDSQPYNIASGVIDGAAALFLDPTNIALLGTAKVAKARRVFDDRTVSQILISGAHPVTNPVKFEDFLRNTRAGQRFTKTVAESDNVDFIHRLTNRQLDRDALLKLQKADSSDMVVNTLMQRVADSGVLQKPRTMRALTARNYGLDQVRLLREMPGRWINPWYLDDHIDDVLNYMHNAKLNEASTNYLMERFLAIEPGDYETLGIWMADLGGRIDETILVKGAKPLYMGRKLMDEYNKSMRHLRRLLTEGLTRPTSSGRNFTARIGGETVHVNVAKMLEFKELSIGLPGVRDIRRATSALAPLVQSGLWTFPVGVLDKFMTTLWKPLQLIRFAWAVRVIGEEQVRMWGSGMETVVNHPIKWVTGMLTGKIGDDLSAIDDPFRMSKQWASTMSRGTGGFLELPDQRVRMDDLVIYRKPSHKDDPVGLLVGGSAPGYGPSERYNDIYLETIRRAQNDTLVQKILDPDFTVTQDLWQDPLVVQTLDEVSRASLRLKDTQLFDDEADQLGRLLVDMRRKVRTGDRDGFFEDVDEIKRMVAERADPTGAGPRVFTEATDLIDQGTDAIFAWRETMKRYLDRLTRNATDVEDPGEFDQIIQESLRVGNSLLNEIYNSIVDGLPDDVVQDHLTRFNSILGDLLEISPAEGSTALINSRLASWLREDYGDLLARLFRQPAENFADEDLIGNVNLIITQLNGMGRDSILAMFGDELGDELIEFVAGADAMTDDLVRTLDPFLDELGNPRVSSDIGPVGAQLLEGSFAVGDATNQWLYLENLVASLEDMRTPQTLTGLDAVKHWFVDGDGRHLLDEMQRAQRQALESMSPDDLITELGIDPARLANLDLAEWSVKSNLVDDFMTGTRSWNNPDVARRYIDGLDKTIKDLTGNGHEELVNLLRSGNLVPGPVHTRRLKKFLNREDIHAVLPEQIIGADMTPLVDDTSLAALSQRWDQTIEYLFDMLMSRNTNRLSRSPAFKQFYWKEVARQASIMSPELRAKMLAKAEQYGGGQATINALRSAKTAQIPTLQTSLEAVDDTAKAVALHEVRNLLYDLNKRGQFADVTRLIFPFAEAWKEVMTTWSKIMVREHGRPLRRFHQVITGARSSDVDQDGQGFFFTDENGVERFGYPGIVAKALDAATGLPEGVSTQLTGRVAGVNLVAQSGFLPGVGPLVQWPAGAFLPDSPRLETVRNLLFPFGRPQVTSAGSALDESFPAWLRKMWAGKDPLFNPEGRINDRVVNNTIGDIALANIAFGKFTPEQTQENLTQSARSGGLLMMIRGALQMGLPTGPDLDFRAEDKDGQLWTFQALADQYREMLREHGGDHAQATQQFMDRFGLEPSTFSSPRTKALRERSVTNSGWMWEREHHDLVRDYPMIAGLLAPQDVDDDFDFNAYLAAIQRGDRVPLTAEQQVLLYNNSLGWTEYNHLRDQLDAADIDRDQRNLLLRVKRAQLTEQYPGFNSTIYLPETPDIEEKIRELRKAVDDPRVIEVSPVAAPLAEYFEMRDTIEAYLTSTLGVTLAAEKQAAPWRYILREFGNDLAARDSNFLNVWTDTLQRELD